MPDEPCKTCAYFNTKEDYVVLHIANKLTKCSK